jgi:hypothetical protein
MKPVISFAVYEAEITMALEQRTARVKREGSTRYEYPSSQQYMFPGFDKVQVFEEFTRARRIARSVWGRMGTLMGGVLAQPLGAREIHVLPAAPSGADLVHLREAGISWVIWDVIGAGEVPQLLQNETAEEYVYQEGSDVDFRIIRLKARSRAPDP